MQKPKYIQWLEEVARLMNEDVNYLNNDPTYSYKYLYDNYPQDRKQIIKDLKENNRAHFRDAAKTIYHPTFSIESDFSGKISKYNPKGIVGGTWSDAPNLGKNASRYTLSDSQMKHGWDVLRTIDYLSDAEDKGVELRMPNGSYPIIDGIRFGGVLPEITVIGKRKKYSLDTAIPIKLNY